MYKFFGGFFSGIIISTLIAIYSVAVANQERAKWEAFACPVESKQQSLHYLKRNLNGELISCVYRPSGKWVKMKGGK